MDASTWRVSGACVRRSAISSGARATQDSQYKYDPGKGKIRICRPAERRARRHALEWILRTRKNSKLEFFTSWLTNHAKDPGRLRRRFFLVDAILLKQHPEESVGRDRNDDEAAQHIDQKHPRQ